MTFPATLWLRPSCSLHYCTGSGAGGVTTASVEGHWPGCRIRHISSEAKIWCAMQLTATCLNKMYCKWHRKPAPEPSQHALGRAKSFVTLECLFVFVFISNIKVRSVQSSADNDSIIIVHMLSFGQNRTWFVKQSTVKTPDKCRGGGGRKVWGATYPLHRTTQAAKSRWTDCAHCHESPWQRCALSSHSAGD